MRTGEGMTDLYAAMQPVLDEHDGFHQQQGEEEEGAGTERPVQLAIMGLPNVVSGEACLAHDMPLALPSPFISLVYACLSVQQHMCSTAACCCFPVRQTCLAFM